MHRPPMSHSGGASYRCNPLAVQSNRRAVRPLTPLTEAWAAKRRSTQRTDPPAKRTKARQAGFGRKPSPKSPEPSQKLQLPTKSSTENQ